VVEQQVTELDNRTSILELAGSIPVDPLSCSDPRLLVTGTG